MSDEFLHAARIADHKQIAELAAENERLREDVSMLRAELRSTGLTDEQIDNILALGRG